MTFTSSRGNGFIIQLCCWFLYVGTYVDQWPQLQLNQTNECGGSYQSPINIRISSTYNAPSLGSLYFSDGYLQQMRNATVINDGHTAMVMLAADSRSATISEGGLQGTYRLAQFHFHWGSTSSKGAEHLLNGIQYAMELHLVHVNTKYSTNAQALAQPDGFAVVGVLFDVARNDNPALSGIVQTLRQMTQQNSKRMTLPAGTTPASLLPYNTFMHYRYRGSLTTPPCSEAVIWTVFAYLNTISEAQLQAFRSLEGKTPGTPLVNNFRPVQPLNGRPVYNNFR
ncbi:carbonic anhydrase-like isoform X2 [Haemaphysalis longicornis]